MSQCGLVVAGDPRGDIIAGSRVAAAKHSLNLVEFSADEARKRFDGFVFDDDMDVLLDPEGGYLHVERCVAAHITAAVRAGATVVSNEAVVSWTADAGGVTVVTAKERYSAERLIFTCGAWASSMLGSSAPPLEVQRTLMGWFDAPDIPYAEDSGFSVFGFDTTEGFFYGFPKLDARGMKVAAHFGTGAIASPEDLDRERRDTDFDGVSAFIRKHLPAASPTPNDFAVCMYTMSPDSIFVVDRHPEHDTVFFAAGFSGHGFKFCPAIGANLAEFCATGCRPASLAFLSASRFA